MNQIERFLATAKAELDENGFERICVYSQENNDTTQAELCEYRATLDAAQSERPIQKFLESHPSLVIGEWGGQCHWVIPQKKLGAEFVPDFVVARLDTIGIKWTLIELQSPKVCPFNSKGHLSSHLNEGLSQINEWRLWLEDNGDYAKRGRTRNGLGLVEISSLCEGIILIGRENDRDARTRAKLMQFKFQNHIDIHSYDWLARQAEGRINFRADRDLGECRCY